MPVWWSTLRGLCSKVGMGDMSNRFSIVIPVYNNEKNLPITVPFIMERLYMFVGYDVEVIMVCDGSPDASYAVMKQMKREYPDVLRIVRFTRNFGQGAATRCGIDLATGDVIGVISCDLQDPFELFVEMLKEYEKGADLVIGRRVKRNDGTSDLWSKAFHRTVHKYIDKRYPAGGFDFYVMSRRVAEDFKLIDAPNGSTQLALLWLGYDYVEVPYERQHREVGTSGWNASKKIMAAMGFFATYSPILTRMWLFAGMLVLLIALALLIASCCLGFQSQLVSSLYQFLTLCGIGLLFFAVALLGEYSWRGYWQSLDRPRYIIAEQE